MFHKHTFNQTGNNLWCECGEIKELPCTHIYEYVGEFIAEKKGLVFKEYICKCGSKKSVMIDKPN